MLRQRLMSYRKHPGSFLLLLLVLAAAVLTVGVLVFLIAYILINGIPHRNCLHLNIILKMYL